MTFRILSEASPPRQRIRAAGEKRRVVRDLMTKAGAELHASEVMANAAAFGCPLNVRIEEILLGDEILYVLRSTPAVQTLERRVGGAALTGP